MHELSGSEQSESKYDFLLPNIHILIDSYTKHDLQSFMDCFAGYHHSLTDEEDAEKTTFITPWQSTIIE